MEFVKFEKKEFVQEKSEEIIPEFKCLIVGDIGSGKSTFLNRFDTTKFNEESDYALIRPIVFGTNLGKIQFNCWDPNGSEQNGDLPDEYYLNGQCAILMFDVTSRMTYKNIPLWYRNIVRVCDNVPIVLVGTKIDVKDRKVKPKAITFHRKKNLSYCEISSLANFRVEVPFLNLATKLIGDESLEIIDRGRIAHPEIILDMETVNHYDNELASSEQIYRQMIEEDDDDF